MTIADRLKTALSLGGGQDTAQLEKDNEELLERERKAFSYIRRKINQLLMVMGTLPLKPEELDDDTLLELDPIGILADAFSQVLEHVHHSNEQLRGAQEEIQAILATAGVGILVVDAQMKIQAFNMKAKELFFRQQADIIGLPCHQVLCNSKVPPPDCTYERVMATRIGWHRTDWTYRDRHYDVAGTPVKNKFGDIVKIVLVYNDITDRKRTETILRESEEMYRCLFDYANDLILTVNPDGSFNYVNRACCETLGYTRNEMEHLSLPDIVHPSGLPQCLDVFRKVVDGHNPGHFSARFVTKGGEEFELSGDMTCRSSGIGPTIVCWILRKPAPQG